LCFLWDLCMDFMGLLGFYARLRREGRRKGEIVRTKISNCRRLVVHFFDTRQRNEPKKTCVRGVHSPYVSPGLCVFCPYGPKAVREAASVLSLGAARTPGPVGQAAPSIIHYSSAARAASMRLHYSLFITPLGQGPHKENGSVRTEQNR
jgi:hypothetical protein